ncbi:MAG: hypothetical protein GON13_00530 [Nanoarchaeota archaeon]|nr:hypothetical protein [Nanoarchaeota archaeon]
MIAEKVRKFLNGQSSVNDCLVKGLINYSGLARWIMKETGIKNFEAVMVACKRYTQDLKHVEVDKQVLKVVKNSKYNVRTGVFVYTVKSFDGTAEHVVKGESATTIVSLNKLNVNFISKKGNLVEITIISPKSIDSTPGVVNYFYSVFSQAGLNIVETFSCFTDTIIIIEKRDLVKCIELLDSVFG